MTEDTFTEAAFTLRPHLTVEVRQAAEDLPPVFTFGGRLRLQFENMETWHRFVTEIGVADHMVRRYRAAGESMPPMVVRL